MAALFLSDKALWTFKRTFKQEAVLLNVQYVFTQSMWLIVWLSNIMTKWLTVCSIYFEVRLTFPTSWLTSWFLFLQFLLWLSAVKCTVFWNFHVFTEILCDTVPKNVGFYFIYHTSSVDKTHFCVPLPHWRSTTVSIESKPFLLGNVGLSLVCCFIMIG